jgi:hypothetical protein
MFFVCKLDYFPFAKLHKLLYYIILGAIKDWDLIHLVQGNKNLDHQEICLPHFTNLSFVYLFIKDLTSTTFGDSTLVHLVNLMWKKKKNKTKKENKVDVNRDLCKYRVEKLYEINL